MDSFGLLYEELPLHLSFNTDTSKSDLKEDSRTPQKRFWWFLKRSLPVRSQNGGRNMFRTCSWMLVRKIVFYFFNYLTKTYIELQISRNTEMKASLFILNHLNQHLNQHLKQHFLNTSCHTWNDMEPVGTI